MNLLPFVILLGITSCLVIEQWALPWRLMPRAARLERIISSVLSVTLLAIIAKPVLGYAKQQLSYGNPDQAVFSVLLLLPLLWLLILHIYQVGLFRRGEYFKLPSPPHKQLALIQDGERIALRLRSQRKAGRIVLQLAWVCSAGLLAAALAGHSGNAPGMVLAFLVAPVGAAVAGLALEVFRPKVIVQIRQGYLRLATCILGGALVGGNWSRHAPVKLLSDNLDMGKKNRIWLAELQRISAGQDKLEEAELPQLDLKGELSWRNENDAAAGLDLKLTMTNRGKRAISPADYDRHAGQLAWQATVGGQRGDVCFRRRDRESSIPAGVSRTIHVRIFPDDDSTRIEAGMLNLTCLGGGSLQAQLPEGTDAGEVLPGEGLAGMEGIDV